MVFMSVAEPKPKGAGMSGSTLAAPLARENLRATASGTRWQCNVTFQKQERGLS